MEDDLGTALEGVGRRLRELRTANGTTLSALSAATGISVSTLSRLESGGRRPTLELLLPLARAHGVPLDELVDAPSTGDPRVHLRPVRFNGATIIPLTQRTGGLRAYKHILPAVRRPPEPDPQIHRGYEWLHVLSGRLRLVLGDRELVLLPGESAEFDTRTPHWMGNADTEPVEFLALFSPEGQRAHLRARPLGAGGADPQKSRPEG
ncbi:helix-turn-helix domain-containing protein [Arthrobacter sp. ISL-28]|uniref:helix-turn-helix domain-containing protein n=1 Tax=Arthrobacter sp. ISL-28 TaxID=2819108 RepID=UPI001BE62A0B|nr:XRE family transcriptional regulator [Arthrobacter sp. ISL-28]MBT2523538.1 helix-turn-helix transcriptional regulator [Arthrobacter sp. ISL-28]